MLRLRDIQTCNQNLNKQMLRVLLSTILELEFISNASNSRCEYHQMSKFSKAKSRYRSKYSRQSISSNSIYSLSPRPTLVATNNLAQHVSISVLITLSCLITILGSCFQLITLERSIKIKTCEGYNQITLAVV